MSEKNLRESIFLSVRQLIGAISSGVLWYVDVENKITTHSFPIITYVIPMGITLGWDFQKILKIVSKDTKFDGMFSEDVDIPTKILFVAIQKGVSPNTIKNALKSGLSEEDLLGLLETNSENLKDIYKKN